MAARFLAEEVDDVRERRISKLYNSYGGGFPEGAWWIADAGKVMGTEEREGPRRGCRGRRAKARPLLSAFLLAFLLALSLAPASCGREGMPLGTEAGEEESGAASQESHVKFSFLVCGDPHGRTDLLAEVIAHALEGEFLVVVGDITTGRGVEEMRRMKGFLDGSGITYHVIPGDNDMLGGSLDTFWQVFGADYYSLDVQGVHLVFLNDAVPGVGCPPRELSWLREDLAGSAGKTVVAFAHVPPGAPVDIGKRGFVARESESNREMRDLLASAGASVIYCGHIHAYMLYASGPPRVVVTGGAGAEPHLSPESGGFHHFLRVTVEDGQVSEEVIPL